MTHLAGQGTPGLRGRPSSPTVAQCSLTWQPSPSQTGGGFCSLVGHALPGHIFSPAKCFVQAPGPDHKKCPFLRRAHLRREVYHRAKPPAKRTSPAHFFLVRGAVAGGHKQHTLPPILGPSKTAPLVPALFMAEELLPKGAAGLGRVLPVDPKQVGQISGESQAVEQGCTSVLLYPLQHFSKNAKYNGNALPQGFGVAGDRGGVGRGWTTACVEILQCALGNVPPERWERRTLFTSA